MSYSMSPPPQKPAPRPYSPYQTSAASPASPTPYGGPPPAKRQRTSPDPHSPPNGASSWPQQPHGLPTYGAYGNPYAPNPPAHPAVQSPYAGNSPYTQSPQQSSFNTPQPYPYQQSSWQTPTPAPAPQPRQAKAPSQSSRDMPPPPPPNRDDREEKVGVDDIGDSLFGSGINLKDEENYLHAMYNNRHNQASQSFSSNQNSSFASSTMTPGNSFHMLTQGTSFGSQDAAAGTLGATKTEEEIELEQRRKREAAARAQAERRQHHLNNQFLQGNNVRKRLDTLARNQGVTLNLAGLFVRQPDPEPRTSVMVNGAGKEGIAAVQEETKRPESVVNQNTAIEHILSLLSLAAGERIRGLLDEAYTLARARRYGDHGRVVPPEFADIAEGEGKRREENVVPENITGSQWDKLPEQDTEMTDVAGESSTPQPQPTISFQGLLNAQLRTLSKRDREAEADRIKKREARKRKASEMTDSADFLPTDSAAPENAAAAVLSQPKVTKKEQIRQQKEKNSNEAQLHHTTNQTVALALGKKGRKYDWMTGGASAVPTNRFAKPTVSAGASGTATPIKAESSSAAATPGGGAPAMARTGSANANEAKMPEWGDWRETGKGIEMRDWALVLERDGREKAALVKAWHKLGK
ncbi:hypothetical protein BDY17DRAFT_294011 [Neohortaea acidophila]|uniref:Transcription initiation factor TFIID subunit 4 n=1 Tax=Neohortaea acidophila TaxID=245834 RepID=A0A6A6Q0Y5_9PEZI|nr:uncharacterized protein BDY17DRAFT_294011 [Neohortaea acidophila]KAF2485639.1 hypothetical protein BDY17DRAFT_294011 [Neohortaea acidophila]